MIGKYVFLSFYKMNNRYGFWSKRMESWPEQQQGWRGPVGYFGGGEPPPTFLTPPLGR